MKWCKRCLETDTRPGAQFDENGICAACHKSSQTAIETIDWEARRTKLKEVVAWAKSENVSGYDCIIGVSGGKDSTRQALFAREVGLNPLLVCCIYPPEEQTDRGVANLANLISLGFDTITVGPAPKISKELMRFCFRKYGNLFNATELALFSSLPITAIAYNIPLILLGENPSPGMNAGVDPMDFSANSNRNLNTLKGGDPRKFCPPEMSDEHLYWYYYPSDEDINRAKLKIVYLGHFIPDFNEHTNARIAVENGLQVRTGRDADPANMGGIYPYIALDDDLVIANQMFKYLKFGFGKCAQEVGSAVRFGKMSRAEGIELIRKYDGQCADFYFEKLCEYLEMSEAEVWEAFDPFINRELFAKDSSGKWRLRHAIE